MGKSTISIAFCKFTRPGIFILLWFRPLVPSATWASLGALLTAVERAGAPTPEAPTFADSMGRQWMFGWTYGSVSKPCTPGEHQNSW